MLPLSPHQYLQKLRKSFGLHIQECAQAATKFWWRIGLHHTPCPTYRTGTAAAYLMPDISDWDCCCIPALLLKPNAASFVKMAKNGLFAIHNKSGVILGYYMHFLRLPFQTTRSYHYSLDHIIIRQWTRRS